MKFLKEWFANLGTMELIFVLVFLFLAAYLLLLMSSGCGGGSGFRAETTHGQQVQGVPVGGTPSPTPSTTPNAVTGTVFNFSGERLGGATISLWAGSQKILATDSESDGGFVFSGLVPGNYYFLTCEKSGYGESRYPGFDNEFFQVPPEGKNIEIYLTQDQNF